jgi:hypothetical protein
MATEEARVLTAGEKEVEMRSVSAPADVLPASAPLATRPAPPRAPAAKPAAADDVLVGSSASRFSDTFGRLMSALAAAQGEFTEIEKKLTASVASRREGARSYTYTYADLASVLAAVRPALSKHGIALMQFPRVTRGALLVTTMLSHGESGEWVACDLVVALDGLDPQAVGSATTYAKRYGLTSLLGVAAGESDDDGAAARRTSKETEESPDGLDAWWLDLECKADEGWPSLEETWAKSNGAFKNWIAKHKPDQWKALKAKALTVKSR